MKRPYIHERVKSIIYPGILVFLSLIIALVTLSPHLLSPIEKMAMELVAPIQSFVNVAVDKSISIWNDYINLVNVQKENRRLKREVAILRFKEGLYKEMLGYEKEIKRLMSFKESIPFQVIDAGVVSFDSVSSFNTIILDRGSSSGVGIDCPVISFQGVVGRTISVSNNFSKVLLLTNYNSSVPAKLAKTHYRAILKGTGKNTCRLEYISLDIPVKPGEEVVTSGDQGIFPEGLPLGIVKSVIREKNQLFQNIEVLPHINYPKLERVFVIIPEERKLKELKLLKENG